MVKVANGAKRNFGFNMVCAQATCGVNGAGAEAEVNFINGSADILLMIDFVLIET